MYVGLYGNDSRIVFLWWFSLVQQFSWWPEIILLFTRTLSEWSKLYQDFFYNYWYRVREDWTEFVFLLKGKVRSYLSVMVGHRWGKRDGEVLLCWTTGRWIIKEYSKSIQQFFKNWWPLAIWLVPQQ